MDGFDRCVGQSLQIWNLGDIIAHQSYISSVHGDVAAHTSHGDADIRGFQRGRIVHAVADHAYVTMFSLQGFNRLHLFLG